MEEWVRNPRRRGFRVRRLKPLLEGHEVRLRGLERSILVGNALPSPAQFAGDGPGVRGPRSGAKLFAVAGEAPFGAA
jgi:hypothetical protein